MTMRSAIQTDNAPAAIGPYSQAISVPPLVFISGQVGVAPDTTQLVSDDISEQAKQVFSNMREICIEAGGSLENVVKLTLYLTNMDEFAKVNAVMADFFDAPYPSRVTIGVSALPLNAKFEAEAIMLKHNK